MPSLRHNKLVIFLALSLAIHAAVLALVRAHNTQQQIHIGSPLTLSLAQHAAKPALHTPAAPAKTTPAPEAVRRTQTRSKNTASEKPIREKIVQKSSRPLPVPATTQTSAPAAAPPLRTPEKTPEPRIVARTTNTTTESRTRSSESRARIQQRIQQKLHARLAFYHYYPMLAIRNQWQGRVNLGLRIEANGQLSNVHVIHSSGYSILDKAAISSLHRVATLPEARNWLEGHHLDMVIPVVYRLVDG